MPESPSGAVDVLQEPVGLHAVYYLYFVAVLFFCFVLERVVRAISHLSWHVVNSTLSDSKTLSAMNLIGSVFTGWCNVAISCLGALSSIVSLAVSAALWILCVAVLSLVLFVAYEYSPDFLERLVAAWNVGIGTTLRAVLFTPFYVVYNIVWAVLPLWNAAVWIAGKLLFTVTLPTIDADWDNFLRAGTAFVDLTKHIAESLARYLSTFSACEPVLNVTDVTCFEPGLRTLDLITPMNDVRRVFGFLVLVLQTSCPVLGAPLDVALYPLMDINFAKAVHNLVNAVLFTVLQVPVVTVERCKYARDVDEGGTRLDVVMCSPDFEPSITMLVSGLRHLGWMFDNWLDITAVVVEEAITGNSPECAAPPLSLEAASNNTQLFGLNSTIVVGLTPGMYARTDGWAAEYTISYKQVERVTVLRAWPFKIDVGYGVAAVRYGAGAEPDDSGHRTTGMMGCHCYDVVDSEALQGTRMEITCAITPFDPAAYETMEVRLQDYLLPVSFQSVDAGRFLECRQVHISVQSVRWPLTRVAAVDNVGVIRNVRDQLLDYADSGAIEEPVEIDAIVYVVPRCQFGGGGEAGTNAGTDAACIEGYSDAGCFPYCFAARAAGSMNSVLTLYNADQWQEQVQLLKRDCGLGAVSLPANIASLFADGADGTGFRYTRDDRPSSFEQLFEFAGGAGGGSNLGGTAYTVRQVPTDVENTGACNYNVRVSTRVQRSKLTAYTDLESVRLDEQPFATAGDAQLLVEWIAAHESPTGSAEAVVRVRRLIGTDTGHFTLFTHPESIPAHGTCRQLSTCVEAGFNPSRVTVPRAYSQSPGNAGPNVATKWSVLYAVNPSGDVYSEYFRWCKFAGNAQLQFQRDSSYGRPRVWRIDAFTRQAGQGISGVPSVFEFIGFSQNTEWKTCAIPVNMTIASMAYLNEQNVAVTVLVASPRFFDYENNAPIAGAPVSSSQVRYDVYYLNPRTMAVRRDALWEDNIAAATVTVGTLCPAMRRLPNFGSLMAELSAVAVYLFRLVPSVLVYGTLIAQDPSLFGHVNECPIVTRGHTLLRMCGQDVFSIDRAFDASKRANAHFWRMFTMLGSAIGSGEDKARAFTASAGVGSTRSVATGPRIETFLAGIATAGENSVNLVDAYLARRAARVGGVLVAYMPQRLQGMLGGGGHFVMYTASIGEFLYVFVKETTLRFVQLAALGGTVQSAFWNTFYDLRTSFSELVVHKFNKACTGVGIALGYGNPLAQMARTSCLAAVAGLDGVFDALSVFFVDYPVVSCLCDPRPGSQFAFEAAAHCFEAPPLEYRAVMLPVIEAAIEFGDEVGQQKAMCIAMVAMANDRLFHAWDVMFSLLYDVAASMQGAVDYLVSVAPEEISGRAAGTCANFYTSPYVMALMPFPLDYFRVCGETPVCRLRCTELMEAFEASRDTGVRQGGRQSSFTVVVEHPLFSETDIVNGLTLPPFESLALVEFESCLATCGVAEVNVSDTGLFGGLVRCFAASGIAGVGENSGMLEVQTFCVPMSPGVSVRNVRSWAIALSDSWVTKISEVFFLHRFEPAADDDVSVDPRYSMLVVRDEGVSIVAAYGEVRTLVRLMRSDEIYQRVNVGTAHVLIDVSVVLHSVTTTHVLVSGRSQIEPVADDFRTVVHCVVFTIDLATLGPTTGVSNAPCPAESNLQLASQSRLAITMTPDLRMPVLQRDLLPDVLLLPTSDGTDLGTCEFATAAMALACVFTQEQDKLASNARLAGAARGASYMVARGGQTVRVSTAVAQSGRIFPFDETGTAYIYSVFSSAHANQLAGGQWVADLRIKIPVATTVSDAGVSNLGTVGVTVSTSAPFHVNVTLERECTVMSCSGCVSKQTQRLCYAAQQCAIAKCVGSVVNLNRPLCMVGQLAKDIAEGYVGVLVSGWIALYEVIAIVVDASTGTISGRVDIQFPHHVVNIVACDTKDVIVATFGLLNSIIASLTAVGIKTVGDSTSVAVTQTIALSTQLMATITNLEAHVVYAVVYYMFAWVQLTACNVNQVLMFVETFDGAPSIRIGTERQISSLSAVGGECMSTIVGEASIDADSRAHASYLLRNAISNAANARRASEQRRADADRTKAGSGDTTGESELDKKRREAAMKPLDPVEDESKTKSKVQKSSGAKVNNKWFPTTGRMWSSITSSFQSKAKLEAEFPGADSGGKESNSKKILRAGLDAAANRLKSDAGTVVRGVKNSPGRMLTGAKSTLVKNSNSKFMKTQPWVDAMVHLGDAAITWLIGLFFSFQDLMQVADQAHCRLPDITVRDAPTCACGDTPAVIPAPRASLNLDDSAFWCTGVLQIVRSNGQPMLVFNPYSLAELKRKAAPTLVRYLDCVASGGGDEYPQGCAALEPTDSFLDLQGVSLLSVLTRCRANYVNKQWDIAAGLLFVHRQVEELRSVWGQIDSMFNVRQYPYPSIAECMVDSVASASVTDRCLSMFLQTQRMAIAEYFAFEALAEAQQAGTVPGRDSAAYIDSCEVFTGPAARGIREFQKCVDDADTEPCELEYFVWAGRSANRVPVASAHYQVPSANAVSRISDALGLIEKARREVDAALALFVEQDPPWSGDDMAISLFTSEGDLLHQMFDCVVLGPYAAADFWPSDSTTFSLPSVRYSRRPQSELDAAAASATFADPVAGTYDAEDLGLFATLSREFELPCAGEALHGDDEKPFTCGSTARRALIKHFMRVDFASTAGDAGQGLVSYVANETVTKFKEIRSRWADDSNFGCRCADSAANSAASLSLADRLACCSADDVAGWSNFRNLATGSVPINGSQLADMIMDSIARYVRGPLLRDTHAAFTQFADSGGTSYEWTVEQAAFAVDLGLLDPLQVVTWSSESEANRPFGGSLAGAPAGTSLWQMCTGMLAHRMFSMPVAKRGDDRWEPDTVQSLPAFDPTADNSGLYASSIEEFVKVVTLSAADNSPTYWHNVARYVASDSAVCDDGARDPAVGGVRDPDWWRTESVKIPVDPSGLPVPELEAQILDLAYDASRQPLATAKGAYDDLFTVLGAFRHRLGSISTACVCMWAVTDNTVSSVGALDDCYIAPAVCAYVRTQFLLADVSPTAAALQRYLGDTCAETRATVQFPHSYQASRLFWVVQLAVEEFSRSGSEGVAQLRCMSMSPSDAWGIISEQDASDWVREADPETYAPHLMLRDILTEGRAGVRLANLFELVSTWHDAVNPMSRVRKTVHSTDANITVAQHVCAPSVKAKRLQESFGSIATRFVDDLFPVLRVEDVSAPVDVCTRFMIEVARRHFYERALDVVRALSAMDPATVTVLEEELAVQSTIVVNWQIKCKNQLNSLALCSMRGVFGMQPNDPQPEGQCPFVVTGIAEHTAAAGIAYVTAGCVVVVDGEVYDPCRCTECAGATSLTLADVMLCPLAVNPLRFVSHPSAGGSLHWARQWPDFVSDDDKAALAAALDSLLRYDRGGELPLALKPEEFARDVLDAPASGTFNTAFSSVPSADSSWLYAEGLLSDGDVSRFCDAMLDWWPEDWNEPVGYHVTTPMYSDEAGYRVFDNAFVVERDSADGVGYDLVRIVYEHTQVRNESLYRNHFGAAGLCGTHSYGMEMLELNTVRLCTETSADDMADPMVPITSSNSNPEMRGATYGQQCADTHHSPWATRVTDTSALRAPSSSGLVSFWYDPDATHWPPSNPGVALYDGLPSLFGNDGRNPDGDMFTLENAFGEGQGCPQVALYRCATDEDCRGLSLMSRSASSVLRCRRGVCVVTSQTTERTAVFDCVSHENCNGMHMCSGVGICVPPVLEFSNALAEAVEAQVFTGKCSGYPGTLASTEMRGASPWEIVDDLLSSSGMCSYRAWFEYTSLLSREECYAQGGQGGKTCTVRSDTASVQHTSTSGPVHRGSLWSEGMLRVEPHACDRDYMHMQGTVACRPLSAGLLYFDSAQTPDQQMTSVGYNTVLRTHSTSADGTGRTLKLMAEGSFEDAPFGFLGLRSTWQELQDTSTQPGDEFSRFEHCSNIKQCHLQKITVNGYSVVKRQSLHVADILNYMSTNQLPSKPVIRDVTLQDVFTCGSFGLYHSAVSQGGVRVSCVLDPAIVPLYYILCHSGSQDQIQAACGSVRGDEVYDSAVCLRFSPTYEPRELDSVRERLNDILNNFMGIKVQNFEDYSDVMQCAKVLYDLIESYPLLQHPRVLVRPDPDEDVRISTVPRGLYYVDKYAVTEFPFAWWVKCTLMSDIKTSSSTVVSCPAWERRTWDMASVTGTVAQALRFFNGAVTRPMYDSLMDSVRGVGGSKNPCTSFMIDPQQDTLLDGVPGRLQFLFRYARAYLERHFGFQQVSQRSCYERKVYNRALAADDAWMQFVFNAEYGASQRSSPGAAQPDGFLQSLPTQRSWDRQSSWHMSNELWTPVCRAWFGMDTNEPWFTAYDSAAMYLEQQFDPERGVPFGFFSHAQNPMSSAAESGFMDSLRERLQADVCDHSVSYATDGRFCIYEKDLKRDPLYVNFDLDETADSSRRPYLIVAESDAAMMQAEALISDWVDGGKDYYSNFKSAVSERYMVRDICSRIGMPRRMGTFNTFNMDSRDDNIVSYESFLGQDVLAQDSMGRSCYAHIESRPDYCASSYVDSYARALGVSTQLQCVLNPEGGPFAPRSVPSPGSMFAVKDSITPVQRMLDYVANPAGDVCYSAQSECLGTFLHDARVLEIPVGVAAALYAGDPDNFNPLIPWYPMWYDCPTPQVPKSLHSDYLLKPEFQYIQTVRTDGTTTKVVKSNVNYDNWVFENSQRNDVPFFSTFQNGNTPPSIDSIVRPARRILNSISVRSMRLAIRNDTFCCNPDIEQCSVLCEDRSKIALQIARHMFHCLDCTSAPDTHCVGMHECVFGPVDKRALSGMSTEEQQLLQEHGIREGVELTPELYGKMAHLLSVAVLERMQAYDGRFYLRPETSYDAVPYMYAQNVEAYAVFDSLPADEYVNSLSAGEGLDISGCAEPSDNFATIDYGQCGMDEYLQSFSRFVEEEYQHEAFPVVAGGHTLAWLTSNEQMTSDTVFSYAASRRQHRDRFVSWLTDLELHCEQGELYSSLCMPGTVDSIFVMNPWVGGDFNPFDLCDTTLDADTRGERYIDMQCNAQMCPAQASGATGVTDEFYQGVPPHCAERTFSEPTVRGPLQSIPTSLCSKRHRANSTCAFRQGVLGGSISIDGFARDGTTMRGQYDLYNGVPVPSSALYGGLFAGRVVSESQSQAGAEARLQVIKARNKLFSGVTIGEAGYTGTVPLRVSPEDLGGNHIRVQLGADSVLRVRAVPLSVPDSVHINAVPSGVSRQYVADSVALASTDAHVWMENIEAIMQSESASLARLLSPEVAHKDSGPFAWDCPYRRLKFWSSVAADGFGTAYPEPRRARRMFGALNDGTLTHPTFVPGTGTHSMNRVSYFTSNGMCVCVSPLQCSLPVSSEARICSLHDTIKSMYDRTPRTVQSAGNVCLHQVDWPFHAGANRDGTKLWEGRMQRNCSVLERLPRFTVAYQTVRLGSTSVPLTTSSEGGDCHVGRAVRRPSGSLNPSQRVPRSRVQNSKCVMAAKNESHAVLHCEGNTPSDPVETVVVVRERSAAPAWLLSKLKERRRQCKDASPVPRFHSKDGTRIENASSFGQPVRVSAERFVASDLHRVLCNLMPDCESVLNMDKWRTQQFFMALVRDPLSLFALNDTLRQTLAQQANRTTVQQLFQASVTATDEAMWQQPWVACERNETTGRITSCEGTISKGDWMDAGKRGSQCKTVFKNSKTMGSLVSELPVCDLSNTTDELCRVLANAENDVLRAHCIATGECMQERYYYSPSVFSVTNGEFVRESVQDFYLNIDPGSCPTQDERIEELTKQNNELRKRCSATQLDAFIDMLESLRLVLRKVVRIIYFFNMIFLSFTELLVPGADFEAVVQRSFAYLRLFIEELGALFLALSNMIFEFVMNGPFGEVLKMIINKICALINWLHKVLFQDVMCKYMKPVMDAVVAVDKFMTDLKDAEVLGVRPFKWVKWTSQADKFREFYESLANCGEELLKCDWTRSWEHAGDGTLPAPTRCWAEYMTSLGDRDSLSCVAADTCATSDVGGGDGAGGYDRVICDACPLADAGVRDFACDPIRKVCSCSVPIIERTPCIDHRQCRDESQSTCVYMDDDIVQTFGNVPCRSCSSEAMCIMNLGERSVGYCSCMLQPQEPLHCDASAVGSRVSRDPTALCLTGLGRMRHDLSSSLSYSAVYEQLAAMPCYMADPSQTFCFNVWIDSFSFGPRVVVLDAIELSASSQGPYRRLFADSGAREPVSHATGWVHTEWADVTGTCSALARQWLARGDVDALGVSDQAALRECLRWRHVGSVLVERYNLTAATDHLFLSWEDFAAQVQNFAVVSELMSNPGILIEAVGHARFMQPVWAVMTLLHRWFEAYVETVREQNETVAVLDATLSLLHALITRDINLRMSMQSIQTMAVNLTETAASDRRRFDAMTSSFAVFRDTPSDLSYLFDRQGALHNVSGNASGNVTSGSMGSHAMLNLSSGRRSMLQWNKELSAVDMLATNVILRGGQVVDTPKLLAEQWITGPASWPPDFSYWNAQSCPTWLSARDILAEGVGTVFLYYSTSRPVPMFPDKRFRTSLPTVPPVFTPENPPRRLEVFNTTRADFVLKALSDALHFLDGDSGSIRFGLYNLFAAIPDAIEQFFVCDLHEVQFCTKYRRTLWNSLLWTGVFLFAGYVLASVMRIPVAWVLVVVGVPFIVLHLSTNYGLFCVPMLPPCILDEAIELLGALIPVEISWPNALQKYPGCVSNVNNLLPSFMDRNPECFVSCSDDPFGYTRWEFPLAWWLCDWDSGTCLQFRNWLNNNDVPFTDILQRAIEQKFDLIGFGDSDMVRAQRICAVMTTWYVLPWLLFLNLVFFAAAWVTIVPLSLLQSFVTTLVHSFIFVHVDNGRHLTEDNPYVRACIVEAKQDPTEGH